MQLYVRRIAYHNIETFLLRKHFGKINIPKEESFWLAPFGVGNEVFFCLHKVEAEFFVQFFFFSGTICFLLFFAGYHLGVCFYVFEQRDFAVQFFFKNAQNHLVNLFAQIVFFMFFRFVLIQVFQFFKFIYQNIITLIHIKKYIFVLFPAEINTGIGSNERVALHEFKIKIGQCLYTIIIFRMAEVDRFVHQQRYKEPQFGNLNGNLLNIHAINTFFDQEKFTPVIGIFFFKPLLDIGNERMTQHRVGNGFLHTFDL